MAEEVAAPGAPVPVARPFAGEWRNYLKSVFKKGFVHKLSSSPSAVFYIAENKTLSFDFFEDARGGLVKRVRRDSL